MRSAQTIIEIVRSRGERGLPIQRVYRLIRKVKARLTGEPGDTETVMPGLAGGGWKSAIA